MVAVSLGDLVLDPALWLISLGDLEQISSPRGLPFLMAMKDETRSTLQSSFLKAYKMACWQTIRGTWRKWKGLKILTVLGTSFPCCHWPSKKRGLAGLKVLQSSNAWSVQEGIKPSTAPLFCVHHGRRSSSIGPWTPHGREPSAGSILLPTSAPPPSPDSGISQNPEESQALKLVAGTFPLSLPMTSFS